MGPTTSQSLKAHSQSFFCCPGEEMTPDLIGCPLVKRQPNGELLRAVTEEMEAYCQSERACHGYGRSSLSNDTLFSESGCFLSMETNTADLKGVLRAGASGVIPAGVKIECYSSARSVVSWALLC